MKCNWLNKSNNKKLIIFFTGWSFDEKPFLFLNKDDFDIVVIYDYNNINFDLDLNGYEKYYLIAWSMGVFIAALLKDKLPPIEKAIALNGTPFPINNDFGIPNKTFELTLKYAEEGLKGKFYQNVFFDKNQLEKYLKHPIERTIENRVQELHSLKNIISKQNINTQNFYNIAYVAEHDKIIPPKNQIKAWESLNVKIIKLADGHFPFYNFKSWKEICK